MSKTKDDTADLTFPEKLRALKDGSSHSVAMFAGQLDSGSSSKSPQSSYIIYLPAPTGLSVSDQANFNTTDFGVFGAEKMRGQILKTLGIGAAKKGVSAITPGLTAEQGFKTIGTIINPNTNTTFSGNGIRSFNFSYKFVPESELETNTIRRIIRRFKGLSYAGHTADQAGEADPATLLLSYPCKWQIKFLKTTAGGLTENEFMPKLFECYLTTVETNYNPNANIFFNNAAPVEIDLSVTFQETRALTRNDIDDLENDLNQEDNFNPPEEGGPTPPPINGNFSSRSDPSQRNVRNRRNS